MNFICPLTNTLRNEPVSPTGNDLNNAEIKKAFIIEGEMDFLSFDLNIEQPLPLDDLYLSSKFRGIPAYRSKGHQF